MAQALLAERSKIRTSLWNSRYIYILLLPVIANFIIFHYLPMFGIQIAFKDYNIAQGITGSPWAGLDHFTDFFQSMYFWPLLKNTLIISFYSIVFGFPAPIILAVLLNEMRRPGYKRVVQTVSYLPYFVSVVILVSMLNLMLSQNNGIVNELVKAFGGKSIAFLQEPKYFRTIYILSGIWQWTGFTSIIYLASITSIDPQLYEAAELDGAGRFSRIWHITLSELMPTVVVMLILRLGNILDVGWMQILLMQNDLNSSVSDVIQTFVYKRGILNSDYSYATAVGLFQSVIGFIFLYATNKISKRISEVGIF